MLPIWSASRRLIGRRLPLGEDTSISPDRYLPVRDLPLLHDLLRRALRHDPSTQYPGPGTQIQEPVGGQHGLCVMFDDQNGVAHVAQLFQSVQETPVVPLMETDARLVEDIEYAHQSAADLACQADTLPLTAGEGGRRAVQCQVVQSYVEHKLEPFLDLFKDFLRYLELLCGQSLI